jgi:hypothetical protein
MFPFLNCQEPSLTEGSHMKNQIFRGFLIAAVILSASVGSASAVTINSTDQGWYDSNGIHDPANTSIFAGSSGTLELHNFFTFDLSSAAGQSATAGSLTIFGSNGTLVNNEPQETFQTFGYTGSIASLVAGTGGIQAFDDLVSGNNYGQTVITGGSNSPMPVVIISLNATALSDINAILSSPGPNFGLAIGGLCFTCLPGQALWGGSGFVVPAAQLSLEVAQVPEPSTLSLIGLGLLGLTALKRRRRTAA